MESKKVNLTTSSNSEIFLNQFKQEKNSLETKIAEVKKRLNPASSSEEKGGRVKFLKVFVCGSKRGLSSKKINLKRFPSEAGKLDRELEKLERSLFKKAERIDRFSKKQFEKRSFLEKIFYRKKPQYQEAIGKKTKKKLESLERKKKKRFNKLKARLQALEEQLEKSSVCDKIGSGRSSSSFYEDVSEESSDELSFDSEESSDELSFDENKLKSAKEELRSKLASDSLEIASTLEPLKELLETEASYLGALRRCQEKIASLPPPKDLKKSLKEASYKQLAASHKGEKQLKKRYQEALKEVEECKEFLKNFIEISSFLLKKMEEAKEGGRVFLELFLSDELAKFFELSVGYTALQQKMATSSQFLQKVLDRLKKSSVSRRSLEGDLIVPIQRGTRYEILLKALKENLGKSEAEEAVDSALQLIQLYNEKLNSRIKSPS